MPDDEVKEDSDGESGQKKGAAASEDQDQDQDSTAEDEVKEIIKIVKM